jgi:DNA-binding TFAR19-related protein (PDSD5 family)
MLVQSIKAVKPEKAAMVEATLIQMYQRGQIRGEVLEGV